MMKFIILILCAVAQHASGKTKNIVHLHWEKFSNFESRYSAL